MHTIRIKSDFKHFKTRENAGTFVASEIVLGAPRFTSPSVVLYTDGSASAAVGREVHRTINGSKPTNLSTTPVK